MGQVMWLTWPQIPCMTNPRYTQYEYMGACYLLRVSTSWERFPVSVSVANLQHFVTVRRFIYDVIDQWPDLIWKWKPFVMSSLNGVLVMSIFISPSPTHRILRLVNHGSIAQTNATVFCKMSDNFWGAPMRTFNLHARLGIIIVCTLILLLGQARHNDLELETFVTFEIWRAELKF